MKKLPFSVTFFLLFAIALLPIFSDLFHPLQLVKNEGNTLTERIDTPFKFKRIEVEKGSFADYIRSYPLKPAVNTLFLFNGEKKQNQDAHCAIFALPIQNESQTDSGSIIALYAEYMYKMGMDEKITFHLTNGENLKWTDWQKNAEYGRNFRSSLAGNLKKWTKYEKKAGKTERLQSFQNYLKKVLANTSILSMQTYETATTTFAALQIGDILWDLGKPGHLCLVVDICVNPETSEKAVLLAQGFFPAQEFHIIKNPKRINDPWYHEEDFAFPVETPEYVFPNESWRHAKYLDN